MWKSLMKENRKMKKLKSKRVRDDSKYINTLPTGGGVVVGGGKSSNPEKISNFVGRVKGLKVFVGNFTYECDFVMLEDTSSVIDPYLGGIVLGKPFMKETGLVYNKDEGTIMFEKEEENITFKMPRKIERFKHIDKDILKKDNIPSFIITGDDGDLEKTTTQTA
ncbi:protein kinase-like domain, concanavalin A-like lectin/glucanase domain protein [Tanacetum coccineum]